MIQIPTGIWKGKERMETRYAKCEDLLHIAVLLILLFLVTACAPSGGGSAGGASAGPSPAPAPAPAPVALQPGPVTVVLKNQLVGQVRQIATGADGWTAIGSADLVLDVNCTLDSADKITCVRYVSEPTAYTTE